jgi:uncharacterized damage-inducible protein DinB
MDLTPDQASFLLSTMLPQIKTEQRTTARVIAAIPSDKGDYRPDERSMTAMDLAYHLASSEMFFMNGVIEGQFQKPEPRPEAISTPADVASWYSAEFPAMFEKLCKVTGEQATRTISFHTFSNPAWMFLQIMIKHSVHHRGQLSAYLRPMGAKVPSIYGGSADEPVTAAASK